MVKNSYLLFLLVFFFSCSQNEKRAPLPILGDHTVIIDPFDDYEIGDTVFHSIPKFHFINQDSISVGSDDYFEHVYVADFFFVTCPTICPVMTSQLKRAQQELKDMDGLLFLSHTVNPFQDTPEVLKKYIRDKNIDDSNWNFVTGIKDEIYQVAEYGYFANAMEDEFAPGGFLHTEKFFLIDKKSRVRGIYNGTDSLEVNQLIIDTKFLIENGGE